MINESHSFLFGHEGSLWYEADNSLSFVCPFKSLCSHSQLLNPHEREVCEMVIPAPDPDLQLSQGVWNGAVVESELILFTGFSRGSQHWMGCHFLILYQNS